MVITFVMSGFVYIVGPLPAGALAASLARFAILRDLIWREKPGEKGSAAGVVGEVIAVGLCLWAAPGFRRESWSASSSLAWVYLLPILRWGGMLLWRRTMTQEAPPQAPAPA